MASGLGRRRGKVGSAIKATTQAEKRRQKRLEKQQRERWDRGEDLPF